MAKAKTPEETPVASDIAAHPSNGNGHKPVLRPDRLGEFNAAADEYKAEPLGFRLVPDGRVWMCKGYQTTDMAIRYNQGQHLAFVASSLIDDDEKLAMVGWLNDNPQPIGFFKDVAEWLVEQYTGMSAPKA